MTTARSGRSSPLRTLARVKPDDARALILDTARKVDPPAHRARMAEALGVSLPTLWRVLRVLSLNDALNAITTEAALAALPAVPE